METCLLALNAGSSSLKFALYPADDGETETAALTGRVERIGGERATLSIRRGKVASGLQEQAEKTLGAVDLRGALDHVLEACVASRREDEIVAIGHRVVHSGPEIHGPVRITPHVIERLARMTPYDPAHQGPALANIEALAARWPGKPQVACFDTTFHAALPGVVRTLPIPRDFERRGVRRYGFHGLSYTYLNEELGRMDPAVRNRGRVVFAHLGNGSSLAAIRDGRPVDTTMSFTPNSGLPMSTRSGELDPGVMLWLAREERMSIEQIFELASRRSGLLAVSETSADVRDLLAREASDARAAEAVAMFCHHVKKNIGAFAAAMGGIDTLVFSGGIGEHAAPVRARVCGRLEFLGIELDSSANDQHAAVISRSNSRVTVRVIPTNEEAVIARETRRVLGLSQAQR